MSRELTFALNGPPEHWSGADHAEWTRALARWGFVQDGTGYRGPRRLDGSALRVAHEPRPDEGRFDFRILASDYAKRPEATVRAITDLVARASERLDLAYGEGFVETPRAPPTSRRNLVGLATFTLLGPALARDVGWDLLEELPGFRVRLLSRGGALVHPPLDGFTGLWSPDAEARTFEAERFLGLPTDPTRYVALAGPARAYAERSRGDRLAG